MTGPIHHVTVISGPPQRNHDFYRHTLGLRRIKVTVNFDDPSVHHLYFGNDLAEVGTVFTTFPYPRVKAGDLGTGQAEATAFAVPVGSLAFWQARFAQLQVPTSAPVERFGQSVLAFSDPDGLPLELIETQSDALPAAATHPEVPPTAQIRGFHSVTLLEEGFEATARVLTELLGYQETAAAGSRTRFTHPSGAHAGTLDIVCAPGRLRGKVAGGSVHHVAFRISSADEEAALREQLVARGFNVTPVLDRKYFTSLYFREPGGVLFEIATDTPGFAVDEPLAELGSRLMLPESLASKEEELARRLAPLALS
ncbi:MAG: ring-cleaving dioxygenase [Bacteroidia bacterium]|nr:ring-cleaving dioxygenase [Bacteroidia bacterium]